MKRGGPLKRKAPPKRGSRLRRVGKRAEREADERAAFRADPPERCEYCGRRGPVQAHHLRPRSRGGRHEPSNRAWLCPRDHDLIHRHLVDDWKEYIR